MTLSRNSLAILLAVALVGLATPRLGRAQVPADYGTSKKPAGIKSWELDPAHPGHVLPNPEVRGIVDPANPATWANLPEVAAGAPPTYGVWIVGPNGELMLARSTWVFRGPEGTLIHVPDAAVYEVDGKPVGMLVRPDGSEQLLTDFVGDLGHPTLAVKIPGNTELKARIAGDIRLERSADGVLSIHINNISGRYLNDGHRGLLSAEKELEVFKASLAKVYKIAPEQITVSNFVGAYPITRVGRFPLVAAAAARGAVVADKGVVVISGGTSGIGLELARKYKAEGYKVAVFGRDPSKVAAWTKEFGDSGAYVAEALPTMDHAALEQFVGRVETKLGKITVLVNNAGISGPFGPVGEAAGHAIAETINTNLTGTINLTSIVVNRMEADGTKGVIVNISSGASRGVRGGSVYAASKAGVNAFTTSAAAEYTDAGIRIFAFNPGHVDTGMQASIRGADPQKFPMQAKMADLKEKGLLVSPTDTAAQVSYLTAHPGDFTNGTMVEYTAVVEKVAGVTAPAAVVAPANTAVSKILTPEILGKARAALETTYPKGALPEISVNGKLIASPKNVDEMIAAMDKLHQSIRESQASSVTVKIGEKTFLLDRTPLGEGMTGVVYRVVGENKAIKISKGSSVALKTGLEESELGRTVDEVARKERFFTPKNYEADAFGIYRLKEEITGDKLTDVLIQKGLLRLEKGPDGVVHAVKGNAAALEAAGKDPVVKEITAEIDRLMKLRKKYPNLVSDLGPDNFILVYRDAAKTKLKGAYFVDIGPAGPVTKARFDAAVGLDGYLDVAAGLVNRYIETGVMTVNPALVDLPALQRPQVERSALDCLFSFLRAHVRSPLH